VLAITIVYFIKLFFVSEVKYIHFYYNQDHFCIMVAVVNA